MRLRYFWVLLLLFISRTVNGNHAFGADLTYKAAGNDTFYVYLSFYYDCHASPSYSTGHVVCTDSSTVYGNFNELVGYSSISDVTPKCPNVFNNCGDVSYPLGIFMYKTVYRVYLGGIYANWCHYKFSVSLCCGTYSDNISNQANSGDYSIEINRCLSPQNSSPYYSILPLFCLFTGNPITINNVVKDNENDSLVTSLVAPPSFTAIYNYGYSPQSPFLSSTAITMNPVSGDLSSTPSSVQKIIIAFKTEEYRTINGVPTKIGEIFRQHVIFILQKNNEVPKINTNPRYAFCAGVQNCITIPTTDIDVSDSTYISWNNAISGATFTTNNALKQVGTFCWTPPVSASRSYPYYFMVTARDNHCPTPITNRKSIPIYVTDTAPTAQRVYTFPGCSFVQGVAKIDSVITLFQPTVTWMVNGRGYNGTSFFHSFDTIGDYPVICTIQYPGGCKRIYNDTVKVTSVKMKVQPLKDTTVCKNTLVSIAPDIIQHNGSVTIKYNGLTFPNNTLKYFAEKDSTFFVEITDSLHCLVSDTFTISLTPSLLIKAGPDTSLCANLGLYPLIGWPSGGSFSGYGVVQVSGIYYFNPNIAGNGLFPVVYTLYNGSCINIDTAIITVKTIAAVNAGHDTDYCKNNGWQVIALHGTPAGGNWSVYRGTVAAFKNNTYDINNSDTGLIQLLYTYTFGNGCVLSDTLQIQIHAPLDMEAGNDTIVCENSDPINLKFKGQPIGGIWYVSGNVIQNDILAVQSLQPGTHSVFYTVSNGICSATDSFILTVKPAPHVNAGPDTTLCRSSSSFTLSGTPPDGIWSGEGLIGNTVVINRLTKTNNEYIYSLSQNGCDGADTLVLHIADDPKALFTATNFAGITPFSVSFNNLSLNTNNYVWNFGDPGSGINNISTLKNPIHTYTAKGVYDVSLHAISPEGCTHDTTFPDYITVFGTGISSMKPFNAISVYPNPVKHTLIIEFNSIPQNIDFEILNFLGETILHKTTNVGSTEINVDQLVSGIYFIRIQGNIIRFVKE